MFIRYLMLAAKVFDNSSLSPLRRAANIITDYNPGQPRGQPDNAGQFAKAGGGSQNKGLQNNRKRVKLNATGSNKFLVKDFINKERREYHVNKHLHEEAFAGMSADDYVKAGIALLESAVTPGGIRGYLEPSGNTIVRYDPRRHWYAVGNPNDGIWSLYSMSPQKFERRYRGNARHGKH